jgi:hypothetical protein
MGGFAADRSSSPSITGNKSLFISSKRVSPFVVCPVNMFGIDRVRIRFLSGDDPGEHDDLRFRIQLQHQVQKVGFSFASASSENVASELLFNDLF